MIVKLNIDDIIRMKKAHPCGANKWRVKRTGMDVVLACLGCGHEIRMLRSKVNKDYRAHISGEPDETEG